MKKLSWFPISNIKIKQEKLDIKEEPISCEFKDERL